MKRLSRSRVAAVAVAFGVTALVAGPGISTGSVQASGGDSTIGSWTRMPSMHSPRFVPAAVRLADGRVLVSGGRAGEESTASAEVFNPATKRWSVTGSLPVATRTHSMVLLKSGRILAAGGYEAGRVASLYAPKTGLWTQTAPMPRARFSMSSIRLPNGEAMFVGGYDPAWNFKNDVQIFNPRTGRWRLAAPMPMNSIDGLNSLTKDGKVLVTGGLASAGVGVYNPVTNTWKVVTSLPEQRWLGNNQNGVALPDGRFVVPGGATEYTEVWTDSVLGRNPHTGQWRQLAPLPAPSVHAAIALVDGHWVLAAGQYPGSATAWLYTPWLNRWFPTPPMPTRGIAFGNPVTLGDGSVLVLGGQELNESGNLVDTDAAMLFQVGRGHDG